MRIGRWKSGDTDVLAALFADTFAASEGAEEGARIGALARAMLADTPATDLRVFTAEDRGTLAGAILFSRLACDGDARSVFVLAPVAVATDRQGEGIGQRLIANGLEALRAEGVDIAVTYGDPAFYGRVGFAPITTADIPAPYALQFPEGWLGQSLSGVRLGPVTGPCRCVAALADPVFW